MCVCVCGRWTGCQEEGVHGTRIDMYAKCVINVQRLGGLVVDQDRADMISVWRLGIREFTAIRNTHVNFRLKNCTHLWIIETACPFDFLKLTNMAGAPVVVSIWVFREQFLEFK